MTNSSEATVQKACFISSPAGAPLGVLRASLEARGVRVLVPHDLTVGTDWVSETRKQLSQADLFIGVLTAAERQSRWVLFDLGMAVALGLRILVITSPDAEPTALAPRKTIVLRIELDNRDAIEFALDQLLAAPEQTPDAPVLKSPPSADLGTRASEFIAILDRSLEANDTQTIENLVAEVLTSSGIDVVVTSPKRGLGPDFAVWSDVLEPFVGNPLLVEVKTRIRNQADVDRAVHQLTSYLNASGSQWALLLYGEGPPKDDRAWMQSPPNILTVSLRELIEALRNQGFPELIRDLRNRRVHGVS